ncbi:ubiquitin-conjugating enzyme E2 G2 [Sarcoptes scabiei]|nr:ubiquitin-conjugating enzyme E2 G2 [Sarcoptes scabiei]
MLTVSMTAAEYWPRFNQILLEWIRLTTTLSTTSSRSSTTSYLSSSSLSTKSSKPSPSPSPPPSSQSSSSSSSSSFLTAGWFTSILSTKIIESIFIKNRINFYLLLLLVFGLIGDNQSPLLHTLSNWFQYSNPNYWHLLFVKNGWFVINLVVHFFIATISIKISMLTIDRKQNDFKQSIAIVLRALRGKICRLILFFTIWFCSQEFFDLILWLTRSFNHHSNHGFDISGHVHILVLSNLFLLNEIRSIHSYLTVRYDFDPSSRTLECFNSKRNFNSNTKNDQNSDENEDGDDCDGKQTDSNEIKHNRWILSIFFLLEIKHRYEERPEMARKIILMPEEQDDLVTAKPVIPIFLDDSIDTQKFEQQTFSIEHRTKQPAKERHNLCSESFKKRNELNDCLVEQRETFEMIRIWSFWCWIVLLCCYSLSIVWDLFLLQTALFYHTTTEKLISFIWTIFCAHYIDSIR